MTSMVVCPDTPYNGTYLFVENVTGDTAKTPMPVFNARCARMAKADLKRARLLLSMGKCAC